MIQNINAQTLAEWQENESAFIVDVREADEFAAGHIRGALNIPLSHLQEHPQPESGTQKLVVHCAAGARSFQAIMYWQQQHPEGEFYNLADSISNWQSAGLALEIPNS